MNAKFFEEQRREMVTAIRAITDHMAAQLGKTALDERVLRAMAKVPRHEFVPVEVQSYAYLNRPIPIGFDKTISQPLMVAVMTDLLELKPDDMVLEIGTGLGYRSPRAVRQSDGHAPDLIPPPLINQLRAGGRMVIPVGLPGAQQL
jgi:protein-L-isoaspartate(D-aspartate) O-methyltransferase